MQERKVTSTWIISFAIPIHKPEIKEQICCYILSSCDHLTYVALKQKPIISSIAPKKEEKIIQGRKSSSLDGSRTSLCPTRYPLMGLLSSANQLPQWWMKTTMPVSGRAPLYL